MQVMGCDMVLPGALDACELHEGQRPVSSPRGIASAACDAQHPPAACTPEATSQDGDEEFVYLMTSQRSAVQLADVVQVTPPPPWRKPPTPKEFLMSPLGSPDRDD